MKVAILAGGLGSRLAEETRTKAKAMVPIGDDPILWHLIRYYRSFGWNEVVVALGYQGDSIRAWFAERGWQQAATDELPPAAATACVRWQGEGCTATLVETGPDTENGGRIKRLQPYLGGARCMLTWCDGLADIDLAALLAFHERHGRLATLTAVRPPARFGRLALDGDAVRAFEEKTLAPDEWINGAFFVLEPQALEWIEGDGTHFEGRTLPRLAASGELCAFRHEGFWQCMDTLKEAAALSRLWQSGAAPWRRWEER
jgi:glucose-1-phosphate cytidylyltransferase